MQGIEFEDDGNYNGLQTRASQVPVGKPSFMMRLLAKAGIIDKTTANLILLGLALIFFGITIFLYASALSVPQKNWALDAKAIKEMHNQLSDK